MSPPVVAVGGGGGAAKDVRKESATARLSGAGKVLCDRQDGLN